MIATYRDWLRWLPILSTSSALVPLFQHIIHFWPGRNVIRRALWQVLRKREFSLKLKEPNGIRISGRYKDYADFHAICEVYLDRVYELNTVNPTPSVVVDAGGHIGTFALLARSAFPQARVLSFEPDPANFALLQANIRRNNADVQIQECALADFEGISRLDGPSSMGRRINAELGAEVRVQRLSRLVDLRSIDCLLIKIDVEGSEWRILDDCVPHLPESTTIFIETHGGISDLSRIAELASKAGFEFETTNQKADYHEHVLRRGVFSKATGRK